MKYFKDLSVQLILSIILAFVLGSSLPEGAVRFFLTLSYLLKDILMFVLPLIIVSYLMGALLAFEKGGPLLILAIVLCVFASNFLSTLIAYGAAYSFFSWMSLEKVSCFQASNTLSPLYCLDLPPFLTPDQAMMVGLTLGIAITFFPYPFLKEAIFKVRHWVTFFLQKLFIPLLPIYVFGFVLKMHREGTLVLLYQHYFQVFLLFCGVVFFYICLLYMIGTGFQLRAFGKATQKMLSAGLTGLTTMSSAASMPITLAATEENLKNRTFAHLIIPATVNNHLLADALGIPLISLAILLLAGHPFPNLEVFLPFAFYFSIARFSAAAVPGGGVLVILPLLHSFFDLNSEALSLITTLYILQDPLFTAGNVMGNGAFAIITEKIFRFLHIIKK